MIRVGSVFNCHIKKTWRLLSTIYINTPATNNWKQTYFEDEQFLNINFGHDKNKTGEESVVIDGKSSKRSKGSLFAKLERTGQNIQVELLETNLNGLHIHTKRKGFLYQQLRALKAKNYVDKEIINVLRQCCEEKIHFSHTEYRDIVFTKHWLNNMEWSNFVELSLLIHCLKINCEESQTYQQIARQFLERFETALGQQSTPPEDSQTCLLGISRLNVTWSDLSQTVINYIFSSIATGTPETVSIALEAMGNMSNNWSTDLSDDQQKLIISTLNNSSSSSSSHILDIVPYFLYRMKYPLVLSATEDNQDCDNLTGFIVSALTRTITQTSQSKDAVAIQQQIEHAFTAMAGFGWKVDTLPSELQCAIRGVIENSLESSMQPYILVHIAHKLVEMNMPVKPATELSTDATTVCWSGPRASLQTALLTALVEGSFGALGEGDEGDTEEKHAADTLKMFYALHVLRTELHEINEESRLDLQRVVSACLENSEVSFTKKKQILSVFSRLVSPDGLVIPDNIISPGSVPINNNDHLLCSNLKATAIALLADHIQLGRLKIRDVATFLEALALMKICHSELPLSLQQDILADVEMKVPDTNPTNLSSILVGLGGMGYNWHLQFSPALIAQLTSTISDKFCSMSAAEMLATVIGMKVMKFSRKEFPQEMQDRMQKAVVEAVSKLDGWK